MSRRTPAPTTKQRSHGDTSAGSTPAWERTLAWRIATHDVIVAGDRMLGTVSPGHEPARLAVVDAIDAALAAGVPESVIDAALARISART